MDDGPNIQKIREILVGNDGHNTIEDFKEIESVLKNMSSNAGRVHCSEELLKLPGMAGNKELTMDSTDIVKRLIDWKIHQEGKYTIYDLDYYYYYSIINKRRELKKTSRVNDLGLIILYIRNLPEYISRLTVPEFYEKIGKYCIPLSSGENEERKVLPHSVRQNLPVEICTLQDLDRYLLKWVRYQRQHSKFPYSIILEEEYYLYTRVKLSGKEPSHRQNDEEKKLYDAINISVFLLSGQLTQLTSKKKKEECFEKYHNSLGVLENYVWTYSHVHGTVPYRVFSLQNIIGIQDPNGLLGKIVLKVRTDTKGKDKLCNKKVITNLECDILCKYHDTLSQACYDNNTLSQECRTESEKIKLLLKSRWENIQKNIKEHKTMSKSELFEKDMDLLRIGIVYDTFKDFFPDIRHQNEYIVPHLNSVDYQVLYRSWGVIERKNKDFLTSDYGKRMQKKITNYSTKSTEIIKIIRDRNKEFGENILNDTAETFEEISRSGQNGFRKCVSKKFLREFFGVYGFNIIFAYIPITSFEDVPFNMVLYNIRVRAKDKNRSERNLMVNESELKILCQYLKTKPRIYQYANYVINQKEKDYFAIDYPALFHLILSESHRAILNLCLNENLFTVLISLCNTNHASDEKRKKSQRNRDALEKVFFFKGKENSSSSFENFILEIYDSYCDSGKIGCEESLENMPILCYRSILVKIAGLYGIDFTTHETSILDLIYLYDAIETNPNTIFNNVGVKHYLDLTCEKNLRRFKNRLEDYIGSSGQIPIYTEATKHLDISKIKSIRRYIEKQNIVSDQLLTFLINSTCHRILQGRGKIDPKIKREFLFLVVSKNKRVTKYIPHGLISELSFEWYIDHKMLEDDNDALENDLLVYDIITNENDFPDSDKLRVSLMTKMRTVLPRELYKIKKPRYTLLRNELFEKDEPQRGNEKIPDHDEERAVELLKRHVREEELLSHLNPQYHHETIGTQALRRYVLENPDIVNSFSHKKHYTP